MPGPLHGIRVIELPAIGPIPLVGMMLADLGAEVTRIDRLGSGTPGLGDALADGPRGGAQPKPEPGVRPHDRLGPGRSIGPDRGPRHHLSYGVWLAQWPRPKDGPPSAPVNYLADFAGGAMFLVAGLLAGLLHSRATGQGQVIDAAMTEGAGYLGTMTRALLALGRWTDQRESNALDGGAPNYRCYRCADDRYVVVGAVEPQFWANLITALGLDPASVPSPYDPASGRTVTPCWNRCSRPAPATSGPNCLRRWMSV
jgi:alpha-methylacyl-CoA racemase